MRWLFIFSAFALGNCAAAAQTEASNTNSCFEISSPRQSGGVTIFVNKCTGMTWILTGQSTKDQGFSYVWAPILFQQGTAVFLNPSPPPGYGK